MSILYTKMNSVLKIVIFILLLTVLINTEDSVKAASNSLIWPSEKEEVIVPQSGGVWYPRLLELENGDWLMSFDTNENSNYAEIKLIKSSNKGQTWGPPITVASEPGGNSANAQMLELENGDIWLAYRYVEETSGGFNTYLRVKVSHDNGDTWQDLPNGQIDEESSTEFKGVWEPHLEYIGNTIAVMYANDGPTAVGNTNWQNIIMKTWDGNSWSNPITVSDGVARGSRDGMPVWTQLESGEYILVYEASNTPEHPFVIEYKISTDGIDWSGPVKELYTPTGFGKKAGAPFVAKLNDGRLVASFQTDEYSANTGDEYSSMVTMISADNGNSWDGLHHTFPVSDNENANWNSLMATSDNQVIAVTSTASTNEPYSAILLRRGLSFVPNNINLVNNWSFETANVNGWTTYGNDYPERLLIHGINDGLNRPIGGGNFFIGMSGTSGPGTTYIGQTIKGLEDGVYTMKAHMRSSGGQNSCIMEAKDFGGGILTVDCPITMNWTPITIPHIYVTNGQATIGFYASINNNNQWADIDMVEFIRN